MHLLRRKCLHPVDQRRLLNNVPWFRVASCNFMVEELTSMNALSIRGAILQLGEPGPRVAARRLLVKLAYKLGGPTCS